MRPSSPETQSNSADSSRTRLYLSQDTIAAAATAPGGAIAIVRVSGPRAFETAASLCADSSALNAEARKLVRTRLLDEQGASLDDSLVVRFIAPESFTGEDVVEFHLHGSGFVVERVLERLHAAGARSALPGEFSFRGIRNGKMTLSQAQAVADLVRSGNDVAVKLALEKLSGSQNTWVRELSDELRQIAVLGEVGIDFSDQDVDEVSLPTLKRRAQKLRAKLADLCNSFDRGLRIQEGIRVAFVGLPNAGKSSFFNALLGEERSIVSEIPGTTRDVVREQVTLRGDTGSVTLRLEDTAGLRATGDRIEQLGIERTRASAQQADLVLFLLDSAAPVAPALEQWSSLGVVGSKTIGILTKADLAAEPQLQAAESALAEALSSRCIRTSSQTGQGIRDAINGIVEFSKRWTSRSQGELVLTRLDQHQAATRALSDLDRALEAPELDLFAADLKQALSSLSLLIGDTLPDDILGRIFSDFCIGK